MDVSARYEGDVVSQEGYGGGLNRWRWMPLRGGSVVWGLVDMVPAAGSGGSGIEAIGRKGMDRSGWVRADIHL